MTARRGRRAGRGALVILALLLASSGALRVGAGVGQAMARAPEAVEDGAPLTCPEPPLALAQALNEREAQVATREAALADRMAALALADTAIEQRLAALTAAEAELSETLARADGAAEDDLARLTSVYETMKPKEAAALFTAMAPEFAAGFLGRMRPEAAAAVLSGMSAEAAYGISVLLAGRNARVPKE
jgi:flagellar motility protein MotE (MotC chaperone)